MMVEVLSDVYDVVGVSGAVQTFETLGQAEQQIRLEGGQLRTRRTKNRVPAVFRVTGDDGSVLGDYTTVTAANAMMRGHPGSRITVVPRD